MVSATDSDDDWDEELEYEDWTDDQDDGDEEMADCPECGKAVYLDANNCPHCGHWFLEEEKSAMSRQTDLSRWNALIIVTGSIALISAWAIWILSIVE